MYSPSSSLLGQSVELFSMAKRRKMALMAKKRPTLNDLPDKNLAEILKRLPVKYILRCSCVQKSWYYVIKSPMFVTAHLNHQKVIACDHPKYIFFETFYSKRFTVRYDDVQCEKYCELEYPSAFPQDDIWCTQSYGLMCASSMVDNPHFNPIIYLWNPLIRKYKILPSPPLPCFTHSGIRWRALAFGFVPEINDYVVVQIVKYYLWHDDPNQLDRPVMIGVYNLSTNSWKRIRQDKVFIHSISNKDAVFVNAAAYWVVNAWDMDNILMRFDTKTDMLREIKLPHKDRDEFGFFGHRIFPFGQKSVAYFCDNSEGDIIFAMWVMKEGLANDFFWEKKMSICVSTNVQTHIFGIRNSGEPILATLNNLISYYLDSHEEYRFVDSWDRWVTSVDTPYNGCPFTIRPFVESLVLLDTDCNKF